MADEVLGYGALSGVIQQETPYHDKDDPNAELGVLGPQGGALPTVDRQGLTKDFNLDNQFTKVELNDQENQQCYWWFYDGQQRRVTKALRIPYTFTRDGALRKAHILIGYEGPSAE